MGDQIFQVAQLFSIAGAAFLSGFIACFSHVGVPTIRIAPLNILVHEFKVMYNIGKSTAPVIAIAITLCNIFLAYQSWGNSYLVGRVMSPFVLHIAAAICVPSIVPYTELYMKPAVNRRLLDLGAKAEKGVTTEKLGTNMKEIEVLLIQWKRMNSFRAILAGMGALLASTSMMA